MIEYLIGAIIGALVTLPIVTANKSEYDYDEYMEGYNAGKKEKLFYEISRIREEAEYCKEIADESARNGLMSDARFHIGRARAFEDCIEILEKAGEREGE